jgi:hypothetical protein
VVHDQLVNEPAADRARSLLRSDHRVELVHGETELALQVSATPLHLQLFR